MIRPKYRAAKHSTWVFCYTKLMDYLFTLRDQDIFKNPEFSTPTSFEKRITVKAVVINEEGRYGFITNPVHKFVLLPGGGAESSDLEVEISRECTEEMALEVSILRQVGAAHEFRNREAKEYDTFCFLVKAGKFLDKDTRTEEEKKNDLSTVWLDKDEALKILTQQQEEVRNGKVSFYNTAFNIERDARFFKEYLKNIKE